VDRGRADPVSKAYFHVTPRHEVQHLGAAPTLPSVTAAEAFWRGEEGALGKVLWSMVERAAIIAPTLYVLGERKRLVRYTVGVTAAIEAVVLWQVKRQIDSGGK
jgi:hypothetical protein